MKGRKMKKTTGIICAVILVFCVSGITQADIVTLNQTDDWGNSDGESVEWSYICELDAYEAFFVFDLSSVPDTYTTMNSVTFTSSQLKLTGHPPRTLSN